MSIDRYLEQKKGKKGVALVPTFKYRATSLDENGLPTSPDAKGRPSFETKVINCNMWRGPYANKVKCQPEYDATKKGRMIQERGYEPQYYEAPEEWSAKPPAKRLSEQWPEYWHPKTRRYITIKKVEFKEHHDNDVDKPKENPKPSNL